MGWLKIGNKTDNDIRTLRSGLIANTDLKIETQHVEEVTLSVLTLNSTSLYPLVPISIADSDLPHIPMVSIAEHACGQDGILLIVIDKIVYDCTTFVKEHPGGETVVKAFAGEDCSWQFWRFHGKKEMEEFGRRLRVGKTDGVKNRYAEIPQYVGLRSRGSDDW